MLQPCRRAARGIQLVERDREWPEICSHNRIAARVLCHEINGEWFIECSKRRYQYSQIPMGVRALPSLFDRPRSRVVIDRFKLGQLSECALGVFCPVLPFVHNYIAHIKLAQQICKARRRRFKSRVQCI